MVVTVAANVLQLIGRYSLYDYDRCYQPLKAKVALRT